MNKYVLLHCTVLEATLLGKAAPDVRLGSDIEYEEELQDLMLRSVLYQDMELASNEWRRRGHAVAIF